MIYIYIYYSYGRISFCKVKKCEILSGFGGTGGTHKKELQFQSKFSSTREIADSN